MSPSNCEDLIKVKTKICDTKTLLDGTVILVNKNTLLESCQNSLSNGNPITTKYEKKVNVFDEPKIQYVGKNLQCTHYCTREKTVDELLRGTNNPINNCKANSDLSANGHISSACSSNVNISESNKIDSKCVRGKAFENNDIKIIQDNEICSETASEKAIRKKVKIQKRWWATGDAVISGVVVCTLGVASWRGLWSLMDLYPEIFPVWPSTFCGITIHLIFAFLRGPLHKHMSQPEVSRAFQWWRTVAGRMYCWVFMCACVLQWRGQWALWVLHVVPTPTEHIPFNSQLATWTGFCALAALRSLRNLLAMPYFVAVDTPSSTYNFVTRFRTSSREPFLFVLDCVFSVVVVGSLVVFVWRGAWDLLDYYLYPDDKVWSAWSSAILGYGLAVLTFLLQPLARRACSRLQAARRLLLADLFLFLSFVATINVWRSVWSLLDIYFLPENPLLSNWITHAGCLILLMLLNCANSVMVRGVYIDAEEDGGQCVVFPCYYLRLFFQKERAKKRQKRLEKAAATANKGDLDAGVMPLVTKIHNVNHVKVSIPEKETFTEKNNEKESI